MPERHLAENESGRLVRLLNECAARLAPRSIKVMEVCGTHTMTARSAGLHQLLPAGVKLISGPGCPVCVTPAGYIDQAVQLALQRDVHIITYGDMIRVPGVNGSLDDARRRGGRVSVVYSINDALNTARSEPESKVVFLGIGFETTTPATAFALKTARKQGLKNFMVLSAHKRIVPAMEALLADSDIAVDGFLAPGHVSVIIGAAAYKPLTITYRRPCVVAGFDGAQMLMGLVQILLQLITGRAEVENVYQSRVTQEGNLQGQRLIGEVFLAAPSLWRGLGAIPDSGLMIRSEFADFDASVVFGLGEPKNSEPQDCRCAEVLKGIITPEECPLFAGRCSPATPVGACMVSREGACSAYFKYMRV